MKVEAHIVAWNESETIHLTVKHYQKFCSKIVIHDNHSTDNTREIATSMGCEVRLFGQVGVLDDETYVKLKNNCWKGSSADWVIVCDADEILQVTWYYLAEQNVDGTTLPVIQGFDIFSHDMPKDDWSEIQTGFYNGNYSKSVLFNPKAIREINYRYGCHVAKPVGNIVQTRYPVMLFHYRNVGGPERLVKRHALYRPRMSQHNLRLGLGCHYQFTDEQRVREWEEKYANCKPYSPAGLSI